MSPNDSYFALLQNVNKRLANIENNISKKSYSEVVSNNGPNQVINKERHIVIVQPTQEFKTSRDTENVIKDIIKPNVLKINIKSKKQVSKGGVLIECETQGECEKIAQEIIKSKSKLIKTEKPKKMKPKIIIKNVNPSIDENNLIQLIREFNHEIDDYLKNTKPEDIENEIKFV